MKKITVKIEGMMCGMCEKHVDNAIKTNFSVKHLKVSHKTGLATFSVKEDFDAEKLKSIVSDAGYSVKEIIEE